MNNREAVNWLNNILADIGKSEHNDLWHYEQALTEIKDMFEPTRPEIIRCNHCEYYKSMSNHWGECRAHNNQTCHICDYCSWAERRVE